MRANWDVHSRRTKLDVELLCVYMRHKVENVFLRVILLFVHEAESGR